MQRSDSSSKDTLIVILKSSAISGKMQQIHGGMLDASLRLRQRCSRAQ